MPVLLSVPVQSGLSSCLSPPEVTASICCYFSVWTDKAFWLCIHLGLINPLRKPRPLSQHSWKFVDTAEAWPHLPPSCPFLLRQVAHPASSSPLQPTLTSLTPPPYSHHSPRLCTLSSLESLSLLLFPAFKAGLFLREGCPTLFISSAKQSRPTCLSRSIGREQQCTVLAPTQIRAGSCLTDLFPSFSLLFVIQSKYT